jgi:hypothetical protein
VPFTRAAIVPAVRSPAPASQASDLGGDDECCICMESFRDDHGEPCIKLSKCTGHYFHRCPLAPGATSSPLASSALPPLAHALAFSIYYKA